MANIIAKPPADKFLRSSPYGLQSCILLMWNEAPYRL